MFSKFNILSQSSCLKPAHRATLRGGGAKSSLNVGKRFGFTLAEILVTLGIIGVVAAMTIPSLMTNVQKKIYVNQLKVAYATIQEGFRRMMADDQTNELAGTELYSIIVKPEGIIGGTPEEGEARKILSQYFKNAHVGYSLSGNTSDDCKVATKKGVAYYGLDDYESCEYLSVDNGFQYILPNFRMIIHLVPCSDDGHCGWIYVDVNGASGPNSMGRDWFWFTVDQKGKLNPWGGIADYTKEMGGSLSEEDLKILEDDVKRCSSTFRYGDPCAARIIDFDNWQMKY